MAITKGQQAIYIRDHDSLDPFEWAGACSVLGSIRAPMGDIDLRTGAYDPAALFQPTPEIEVESGPSSIEDTLTVQKEVRGALVESWLRCRWDVDIRSQECGRRDDYMNWMGITRICRAKFLEYASDGDEVITSPDDEGVALVTSGLKAPWPLVHLWPLAAELLEASTTEDFTALAVCEEEQCADAVGLARGCTIYMGTTGFYGTPMVYLSDDEGENWTSETLTGWDGDVDDVDCLGDFVIVVSAHDDAAMWSDDGAVWTEVSLPPGRPWAVRIFDLGLIVVVGEDGQIWRSLDAARTFTPVAASPTAEHLHDLTFVDSQVWWAIGENNTLIQSQDGAATWVLVTTPVLQAGVDISAILALDENRVLLGYADGELWYTDDGAETWTMDASVENIFSEIAAFAECGCGRILMVGYDVSANGLVYENIDSGAPGRWSQIEVPAAMGALADIVCCDANTWLGCGSGAYMAGAIGQVLKIS